MAAETDGPRAGEQRVPQPARVAHARRHEGIGHEEARAEQQDKPVRPGFRERGGGAHVGHRRGADDAGQ
eukprot:6318524-Prymnesium_polylepis.1